MQTENQASSRYGLEHHGIHNADAVYWNLSTPHLYEEVIRRHEGRISHSGALVVRTGQYTGRSPRDKYIVREPASQDKIWWDRHQPADGARPVRQAPRADALLPGGQGAVRSGLFRRGRPRVQHADRVITELRVAQPVRPQPVHHGRADASCRTTARFHGARRAQLSAPIPAVTARAPRCSSS